MSGSNDSPYLDRGALFLAKMEKKVPWNQLISLVEPDYLAQKNAFNNVPLENLLRIFCLQEWLSLCDAHSALSEDEALRSFAGIADNRVPSYRCIRDFCSFVWKGPYQRIRHLVSPWDEFVLPDYLTPYPEPEQVFTAPVEKYSRHLLPLASIDLSAVNPAWSGQVHLVSPIDSAMTEYTKPFHNYYLRLNWLAFRVDENSRYELMGDFRYFLLENEPGSLEELAQQPSAWKGVKEEYDRQRQEFLDAKRLFTELGPVVLDHREQYFQYPDDAPQNDGILSQVGGSVSASNWFHLTPFPSRYTEPDKSKGEYCETDIRPLAEDGSPFHFIASAPAYYFTGSGADEILLFYEPNNRIALLTFEFT